MRRAGRRSRTTGCRGTTRCDRDIRKGAELSDDLVAIVLVEGESDRIALDTLAARLGRDLAIDRVAIHPTGGVHAIGRFLSRFGPTGLDLKLAGLCDEGEAHVVRRSLEAARFGVDLTREAMEGLGFYVCSADLEDELVRALGPSRVEQVIDAEGELRSFRTFQKQIAKRGLSHEEQLWRFMWNRKVRYAAVLVEALDLGCVPRPLDGVLAHVLAAHIGQGELATACCESSSRR